MGIYIPERGLAFSGQMEITENCNGEEKRESSFSLLFQTELADLSLFKHLERTHKAVFQF